MAMTIQTKGLDELNDMLAKLGGEAMNVASGALYDGAGVVADAMRAAANSIACEPQRPKNRPPAKTPARLPTPAEKAAVVGKTGVAKFRKTSGEVNTLIGVAGNAGYAMINGKKKPVRMIARAINSGTSFMKKQPVFRRAKSMCTSQAQAAIVAKAEEMFNEIINR